MIWSINTCCFLHISAANDFPQPHVCVAFGFLNEKPPPISASLKSSCIPNMKRRLFGSQTAHKFTKTKSND